MTLFNRAGGKVVDIPHKRRELGHAQRMVS